MPDPDDIDDLFEEVFDRSVEIIAAAEGAGKIGREHQRRAATMMLASAIGKMRDLFGEAEANRIIRERAARAQEHEHKHG